MADLLTIESLFTLFMLVLLQAVLGFDNLLYIAIESNKVGDPNEAKKVRKWGIGIAVVFRILLLFIIVSVFSYLAEPIFAVPFENILEGEFTVQALVTLLGGGFIIYTAVKEIHHLLAVDHIEHSEGSGRRTMMGAIALIVAMNLVFSVDSILSAMAIASVDAANIVNAAGETLGVFQGSVVECKAALIADPMAGAVGCEPTRSYQVPLMVIAIVLSGLAMILLADRVTEFLKKNRMYEVLGLFILFLVGVLLVTEGAHLAHLKIFGFAIDAMSKSSFYLVVGVLIITDVLSNRYQKRLWAQREAEIVGTNPAKDGLAAVDAFKAKGKGGSH
ncbi:putative tellurium resistance membrane protein TerC [Litorimonas taeanensis]|uniref:Putative tellurium resistance membrane protein TerC n=1 Tax=Litorimonas taeanensis TaxID=568099 RepID=A0A420WFQ6_9PROT|nr:tellurium resistance protein TerC [Litorimonas taeanensis]RKQ69821.1 putative tellurium resistance membrane protein TerC [Litorimonas taeanensis]